jgi:hypothetical protein
MKSTETVNRSIPGPGDEIEAEADAGVVESEKVSVVFLVNSLTRPLACSLLCQCEQISHHPPISAAYYGCPEKGIEAVGVDQITAKVSGMCRAATHVLSTQN